MTTQNLTTASLATVATLITSTLPAADSSAVAELAAKIKSKDDKIRGPAWQNAGPMGAAAVKSLVEIMADPDMETARSAKRGLWQVVRYAGRPGAKKEAQAVGTELISLLPNGATSVRRELLWMLSEIAGDEAVAPMAALLTDKELREDARCSLTRLPGAQATAALKTALAAAPEDFKPALAQSLRVRGVKVEGYPSQKLVPTKKTNVTALKPA